jgi:YebC/PmpR family DNA-binding regulatory protein
LIGKGLRDLYVAATNGALTAGGAGVIPVGASDDRKGQEHQRMSGHSKWSTIKRKKAAADAKRGKVFTQLIRELTMAARVGGSDPAANPRLRLAIDNARSQNMPKDNIERAIKKGAGELEGEQYEEVIYEGYGPGGAAVMVDTVTDNRNRTVSEIRHLFGKYGGNLGATGCVAYLFEKRGVLMFEGQVSDSDRLFEIAIEANARDLSEDGNFLEIDTEPEDFAEVKGALTSAGFEPQTAEVTMVPQTKIQLSGREAQSMLKLFEALDDHDDVRQVYANFDISEEEMVQAAEGS